MVERAATAAALLALSFVAGCNSSSGASDPTTSDVANTFASAATPDGFELVTAELSGPAADGLTLTLWYAATPDQWHVGLTGVTDLGPADGMLFEFDREGAYRFHMWQTPMPLDVYFFDSQGAFAGMREMVPCLDRTASGCDRYAPDGPFLTAIEVPAGSLDASAIDETWSIADEASPPVPSTTDHR